MYVAKDVSLGRPKKFKDEETKRLTVMIPLSLRTYLREMDPTSTTDAAIAAIEFYKDLEALLESSLTDLRVSSARAGLSYEEDHAQAIARLVVLGLECEKKSKK